MQIRKILSLLVFALATGAAAAQPVNDTCDGAVPITAGSSVTGTTVGAAADGSSACDFFGSAPDVYYQFTAGDAGAYQFDTIGSPTLGNIIAVYDACPADFAVDCDLGTDPSGQALLQIPLSAGQTVFIGVSDGNLTGQSFTLNVTGPLAPPVNDECDAAIPLTLDTLFIGDNVGATTSTVFDAGTDCNSTSGIFAVGADDVFFTFTPAFTGFFDVSTCGSGFDTVVSVHAGCPATPANAVACFDDQPVGSCVPANPVAAHDSYLPGLALDAGVTYTIRVAGFADRNFDFDTNTIRGGRQGDFQILVSQGTQVADPPPNDQCAGATPIGLGPTSGSNVYATGQNGPCTAVPDDDPFADPFGVWYAFTAPDPGTNLYEFIALADVAEADQEISMALLDSCGGEPRSCLATNLNTPERRLAAALTQGQTVLLRIAGLEGTQLGFTIDVSDAGAPAANGTCATAQQVSAGTFTPVNLAAAPSSLPPGCGSGLFDINALWYSFTAPQDAYYRIAADSSDGTLDTELAIFDACAGSILACASDGDGQTLSRNAAAATLRLDANQTVLIRAASNLAGTDAFDLQVSLPIAPPPPPPNDDCATATPVDAFPFSDSVEIGAAAPDLDTDCNDPSLSESVAGVWYALTPSEPCLLTIDAFSPSVNLAVAAFRGDCSGGEPLTEIGCVDRTLSGPGMIAVDPGVTYHFLIHAAGGEVPVLAVANVTFGCAVIPPNDTCAGAERIAAPGTTVVGDITNALPDGEASCGPAADPTIYSSLWYAFTTDTRGRLTVHDDLTTGVVSNAVMTLYTGGCGGLTEVVCANNDSGSFFPDATYDLATTLAANTTYHLAVGSRIRPESMINSLTFDYTGNFAPPCEADLDDNGAVDVFDLLAYLGLWFDNDAAAERTGDNPPNIDVFDLLAYLDVWFAGCP